MRTQGNDIIRDAATELGLPWGDGASAYASTDVNVRQLLAFANAAGQELAREYNWTTLQKRLAVNLVAGDSSYPLPADFLRMIPETLWGQPNTWRSGYGGPTASQWEDLTHWFPAATLRLIFRIQGEALEFSPTPASNSTVTLAYQSSRWAAPMGGSLSGDSLTAQTPETVFDRRLIVNAVKVRYLEARGFDSMSVRNDFERALSSAMGADGVAPTLRIGGSRWALPPTLRNLPHTDWGK